jgi:hypothetical protein
VDKTNWTLVARTNWTDRPPSIPTPAGDWMAPSLGALVYDARANRINERAYALFGAMLMAADRKGKDDKLWLALAQARKLSDETEERQAQAKANKRHQAVMVQRRFAARPDPATALAIAIETEELRQASPMGADGKREFRATKEQTDARRWALYDVVEMQQPMTVRQAFYQATVHKIVAKTEGGCGMVKDALGELRKDGVMPYYWLVDNTRRIVRPRTFSSLQDAVNDSAKFYRKSLWKDADANSDLSRPGIPIPFRPAFRFEAGHHSEMKPAT